jgi:hypothetical protein
MKRVSGFSQRHPYICAKALAMLMAPLLGVLYVVVGRERRFVVPKYLSTVPNKERKPWIVNLVFKGDAFDFDENGSIRVTPFKDLDFPLSETWGIRPKHRAEVRTNAKDSPAGVPPI